MSFTERLRDKLPGHAELSLLPATAEGHLAEIYFRETPVPPFHLLTIAAPQAGATAEFIANSLVVWREAVSLAEANPVRTDNGQLIAAKPYLAIDLSGCDLGSANFLGLSRAIADIDLTRRSVLYLLIPPEKRAHAQAEALNVHLNIAQHSKNFTYIIVASAQELIKAVQATRSSFFSVDEG